MIGASLLSYITDNRTQTNDDNTNHSVVRPPLHHYQQQPWNVNDKHQQRNQQEQPVYQKQLCDDDNNDVDYKNSNIGKNNHNPSHDHDTVLHRKRKNNIFPSSFAEQGDDTVNHTRTKCQEQQLHHRHHHSDTDTIIGTCIESYVSGNLRKKGNWNVEGDKNRNNTNDDKNNSNNHGDEYSILNGSSFSNHDNDNNRDDDEQQRIGMYPTRRKRQQDESMTISGGFPSAHLAADNVHHPSIVVDQDDFDDDDDNSSDEKMKQQNETTTNFHSYHQQQLLEIKKQNTMKTSSSSNKTTTSDNERRQKQQVQSRRVLLQGPKQSGKSSLLMDMALHIARYEPCRCCSSQQTSTVRNNNHNINDNSNDNNQYNTNENHIHCQNCIAVTIIVPIKSKRYFPLLCIQEQNQQTSVDTSSSNSSRLFRKCCERIHIRYVTSIQEIIQYLLSVTGLPLHEQPVGGIFIDDIDILCGNSSCCSNPYDMMSPTTSTTTPGSNGPTTIGNTTASDDNEIMFQSCHRMTLVVAFLQDTIVTMTRLHHLRQQNRPDPMVLITATTPPHNNNINNNSSHTIHSNNDHETNNHVDGSILRLASVLSFWSPLHLCIESSQHQHHQQQHGLVGKQSIHLPHRSFSATATEMAEHFSVGVIVHSTHKQQHHQQQKQQKHNDIHFDVTTHSNVTTTTNNSSYIATTNVTNRIHNGTTIGESTEELRGEKEDQNNRKGTENRNDQSLGTSSSKILSTKTTIIRNEKIVNYRIIIQQYQQLNDDSNTQYAEVPYHPSSIVWQSRI